MATSQGTKGPAKGSETMQMGVEESGKVHAAKPQLKETYCGRPLNEEEWLITSKEVSCTGCARAGAPTSPEGPGGRGS